MVQALRGVAHICLLLGNAGFDDRNWSSLETQSGQRKANVGHPRIGMEGRCTIVKFFDDNDGNCASPRWYDPTPSEGDGSPLLQVLKPGDSGTPRTSSRHSSGTSTVLAEPGPIE